MTADLAVFGKVFTSEDEAFYAEGFAVKDGKILAVGTKEEIQQYIGKQTGYRGRCSGNLPEIHGQGSAV